MNGLVYLLTVIQRELDDGVLGVQACLRGAWIDVLSSSTLCGLAMEFRTRAGGGRTEWTGLTRSSGAWGKYQQRTAVARRPRRTLTR